MGKEEPFGKVLEEVRSKFKYLGEPFVNSQGKIFLNPGDRERYDAKISSSLGDLLKDGKLTSEKGVITLQVTDKCLKSELQVEVSIKEE